MKRRLTFHFQAPDESMGSLAEATSHNQEEACHDLKRRIHHQGKCSQQSQVLLTGEALWTHFLCDWKKEQVHQVSETSLDLP
jgi:hypothetical protein